MVAGARYIPALAVPVAWPLAIDGSLEQRRTASFTTLKLTFVPEPGTVLLLGAAAAALVLARRQ